MRRMIRLAATAGLAAATLTACATGNAPLEDGTVAADDADYYTDGAYETPGTAGNTLPPPARTPDITAEQVQEDGGANTEPLYDRRMGGESAPPILGPYDPELFD